MQFDKSFPIIMRGLMTTEDWVAMSWSPKDWCQALSCDTVRVRSGQVDPKLDHPQWERYTFTKDLKSEDFFNENWRQKHISENEWCYFDYQYLHQIMDPDTLKLFSWAKLGLSERDGSDSTFWAGTRGSHTPCHQDSYGCNLVCQISGTKASRKEKVLEILKFCCVSGMDTVFSRRFTKSGTNQDPVRGIQHLQQYKLH